MAQFTDRDGAAYDDDTPLPLTPAEFDYLDEPLVLGADVLQTARFNDSDPGHGSLRTLAFPAGTVVTRGQLLEKLGRPDLYDQLMPAQVPAAGGTSVRATPVSGFLNIDGLALVNVDTDAVVDVASFTKDEQLRTITFTAPAAPAGTYRVRCLVQGLIAETDARLTVV